MSITGVAINLAEQSANTGGVPVAIDGAPPGSLVDLAGQLQYGSALFGAGSRAGWRDLVGWRNLAGADVSDAPRPQAHGAYPGSVYGGSIVVTFTFLVTGKPDAKAAALDTIEAATRMDGVERPLVVNDGSGAWLRMARVIARDIPQGIHFLHGPVEGSVQFLCADPRRYSLRPESVLLALASSSGGLDYPADYPLQYGTYGASGAQARNRGTEATPMRAIFRGPLLDPALRAGDRLLRFRINLAAGESLHVDTNAGTALLNGTTDRLSTIANDSDPLELCYLEPGRTDLQLTAAAGTGQVSVSYSHARH